MKALSLFVCCILLVTAGFSQGKKFYLYGELGGGNGTHDALKLGLNSVIKNKHIVSLSYYYHSKVDDNAPADFYNGFTLFGGDTRPGIAVSTFCLSYGRMITFPTPYIRLALKGGVGLGTIDYPDNYRPKAKQRNSTSGRIEYDYDYLIEKSVALVLNPTVELPVSRHFGFTLGLYSNINSRSSVFGVEGGILFGHIRDRRKRATEADVH